MYASGGRLWGICKSFPAQGLSNPGRNWCQQKKSHQHPCGGGRESVQMAPAEEGGAEGATECHLDVGRGLFCLVRVAWTRGVCCRDPKNPMTPGNNADDVSKHVHQKMPGKLQSRFSWPFFTRLDSKSKLTTVNLHHFNC